jgi:eukaryotic-like serine/threonine-protein kinase
MKDEQSRARTGDVGTGEVKAGHGDVGPGDVETDAGDADVGPGDVQAGDVDAGSVAGAAAPSAVICSLCAATYPAEIRFCPVDGNVLRPLHAAADDLVGRIIDERYFLLEKLGEGGMGDVYLGEHVRTQRRCAVKVVSRRHAHDPEALGRFVREATNAGRMHHPHVATLYDFGETADGITYLAMEYIEGEPLSRLLEREGALPPARAVEIARQVAEGVGAAHEAGIVHRDLKPSNILIARDRKGGDVVKVVDFGISRAPAEDMQNLTRTGFIIGTPEYMSPEQLIGDPVDGRSDIYSLGCILYQMLTGAQAFAGPTAQVITRRLTEQPPRPRDKNPEIPKPLDELIVTALGRTPQERFQSMEAVRDALLAAPTQPVATGPRRLASWLGLHHEPRHASGSTAERPSASPSTGQPAAAAASTGQPAAASTGQPASPSTGQPAVASPGQDASAATRPPVVAATVQVGTDAARVPPTGGDLDADMDAAAALMDGHDTGEFGAGSVPVDEPPLRRLRVPLLAAAMVAVLLLVSVVGLLSRRPAQPAEPPPVVETEAPVAQPDDSVLAALWADLSTAEQEEVVDDYSAALGRLRAAEAQTMALLARFPGHPDLEILRDSVRSQILATERRCDSVRTVALRHNRTPPVCDASQ